MWWPGPALTANYWYEAHNSPGATATATRWITGGGEAGGADDAETYVLIANTTTTPGRARVTLMLDSGPGPPAGIRPAREEPHQRAHRP